MRTEITRRKLYKFKELSENAKTKALDDNRDWNTNFVDWWDSCYEDAKNIGLELESFDLYQRTIDGKLDMTVGDSIKVILNDHGPSCETYALAEEYRALLQLDKVNRRTMNDEDWEQEDEGRVSDYRKALLRLYLHMLDKEYEHLESDESISESFEANETEFLASGALA